MRDILSTSPTLLLVESNEDEAVLFQRIFTSAARHWHLVWEKDGSSAVRRIMDHGFPDLLVTRIEMPRLSGIDLIEWVRSLQSPKFVPVLIYDRAPSSPQREQLSNWAVEEYLDKRSPPEKFKILLRRLVADIEKDFPSDPPLERKAPAAPGFNRSYPA
jgi:two-component system, chemotaxis family, chemotaxis protein CheY